jgi:hypothetical protein
MVLDSILGNVRLLEQLTLFQGDRLAAISSACVPGTKEDVALRRKSMHALQRRYSK